MQAYHIPLHEAMALTLPQIVMLNHGALVNRKKGEEQFKRDQARKKDKPAEQAKPTGHYDPHKEDTNPVVMDDGRRVKDLTTDEFNMYFFAGMDITK